MPDSEPPEIDFSGCPAIGIGGYHSRHFDPEEGGMCQWCGTKAPEAVEDATVPAPCGVQD